MASSASFRRLLRAGSVLLLLLTGASAPAPPLADLTPVPGVPALLVAFQLAT